MDWSRQFEVEGLRLFRLGESIGHGDGGSADLCGADDKK
jgi:hypothetical protein